MTDEKRFQTNIELWAPLHPKEAVMLPYTDCDDLKFSKTKKGELTLHRGRYYYHSKTSAMDEAHRWFQNLKLDGIDVLYVFGVGLGYYYKVARKWLKRSPKHHIVFLEDDPAVIHRFFETPLATELLKDSQARLYYFRKIDEKDPTFVELYWNFVMAKMTFSSLKLYKSHRGTDFEDLRYRISYDAALKNSLMDEYLRYGYSFFRNFYANLSLLPKASLGNGLFGKFKNVPAVICGAGPSLKKNISLLKTLEDRALIFAGSSALNAITSAGIKPHLGAGLDPNPMQEIRLKGVDKIDFPFLYRNRMYPQAMDLVKGPHLYMTGSGGYDVAEWFEKELNIQGELIEEGRNVVNFCLEIANKMGCNPIIFVGMDLAYTGMESYCPGVVDDTNVVGSEELIEKEDIKGKPTQTLWKWVAESHWIGDFAKEYPEVSVINATEGGLGFPGVPNQTLKSVSKKYLTKTYRLRSRIQKEVERNKIKTTSKQVIKAMKDLRDSLLSTLEKLDILIQETEKVAKRIGKEKREIPAHTPRMALAETEITSEPAYQYVLDVFSSASSRLLNPDLKKIATSRGPEWRRSLKKLDLTIKKYTFLRNAASVNLELLEDAICCYTL